MQFLNQEIEPLAGFAAFFQHRFDLVQVRGEPAQFLGHIDADGERGGFGKGPVLRGFRCDLAFACRQRLLPACQKALLLRLHRFGHQRFGRCGQPTQLRHAFADQLRQPLALTRTRGDEIVQHRLCQRHQRAGGAFIVHRFGAAGHAQHIGHRERLGIGQPNAHLILHRRQPLQQARGRIGDGVVALALQVGTQLDLAAFEARRQQSAQGRFVLPQLVGKTEPEVQKPAVDRAQLQAQPAVRILPRWCLVRGARHGLLAAGVTRHTVN